MKTSLGNRKYEWGFPIPDYRFDQKNEMFKRALWDEALIKQGDRFYREVVYKDKPGWRKLDYAAHTASWNLEDGFALGIARSNWGLYSWKEFNRNVDRHVRVGDAVTGTPREMSLWVKSMARHFGADLVGVCKVHPNWVYSREYNMISREHYPIELPEGCHNAVVMAIAMDYETIRSESMVLQGVTVGWGYSMMAFVANLVAAFIRGLGYRAIPSGNDTALSVPLAMAAGLGEMSRMGLLVTKRFGPRVRLCKIFTDMPLEYDAYQPFGVKAFCMTCKTCAETCPSQAIPYGEPTTEGPNISNQSGVLKWYNNHEKCFTYWASMHADCVQCIRVCPFNKGKALLHDFSRFLIRRTTVFNKLLVKLDRLLGYQEKLPVHRFWQ